MQICIYVSTELSALLKIHDFFFLFWSWYLDQKYFLCEKGDH